MFSPDVVLLDLSLFEHDEIELVEQLRRGRGFDAFLTKPFDFDVVIHLILPLARLRT